MSRAPITGSTGGPRPDGGKAAGRRWKLGHATCPQCGQGQGRTRAAHGQGIGYVVELPRPASRARTMAAGRSLTWSFTKMFDTLLRTVFSLSASRSAMTAFGRPAAIRSRMSCSRVVSAGESGRGAAVTPVKVRRHSCGQRRADDDLSSRDGRHRAHDLIRVRTLEDVSAGAGAQRREDRRVVFEHGQHQHTDIGLGRRQFAGSRRCRSHPAYECPSARRPGVPGRRPRRPAHHRRPHRRTRARASPRRERATRPGTPGGRRRPGRG